MDHSLQAYMVPDKDIFKALIMQRRDTEFQALRRERERRMAEVRQQHRIEREIARRKAYVVRCRAEVEQRMHELEEQQRREEEQRKKVRYVVIHLNQNAFCGTDTSQREWGASWQRSFTYHT